MMTENKGFDKKDIMKEVIWTALIFIGLFAYGAAMLLIISFVIHSWFVIDLKTIIWGALIFAIICIMLYIVKKVRASNGYK